MSSLAQVLDKYRNIGPGFDFLRIGLAVSIVATHCLVLSNNVWFRRTPLWYTEYALVPMFFALSGFLVTGSAMRLSLKNFLINRGLRIIPALATDTIVCAMIIGPIVTTYPPSAYFSNHLFFKYLLNSVGLVHFYLPGVFTKHPSQWVNGALWTVPCELSCYIIMSLFIVTGWIRRPILIAISTVLFLVVSLIIQHLFLHHGGARPPYIVRGLNFYLVTRRGQVVVSFLMGIVAYQQRHVIPYSWWLFGVCCIVCAISMYVLKDTSANLTVLNRFIVLPPLVYMTVFLGLTEIKIPSFLHRGDYSYGIYLYHFPLLQVLVGLMPATIALKGAGAVLLFVTGLPVVFAFAWCSWHFVEKPILVLRKKFSFVAKVRGIEPGSVATAATPVRMDETRLRPDPIQ